jgi:hypothetical protein
MMQTGVTDKNTMGGFFMQMKSFGVGLCLTCNNADTCVYRERRGADATYCEMFDDYVSLNGRGSSKAALTVAATEAASGSAETKGLCLNCAHHDGCRLPRPETGVWHCEEYE